MWVARRLRSDDCLALDSYVQETRSGALYVQLVERFEYESKLPIHALKKRLETVGRVYPQANLGWVCLSRRLGMFPDAEASFGRDWAVVRASDLRGLACPAVRSSTPTGGGCR